MANDALFTPLKLGALELPNRILMAPLTRCRAEDGHIPGPLIAEYYAQRAGAGLIIAEATMVMAGNSAFWREPGVYSAAQVEGWRRVTDAVHAKGGRIALQLWHGGRACHPLLNDGATPVAPSAIAIDSEVMTPHGMQPYVTPHALADDDLPAIIDGFAQAARNARAAGFDMVEVHGANGYLLDEFLRDGSNRRDGPYGGALENRARLMFETLQAVVDVWGADRVGLRLSPLNSYNSMQDSDPVGMTAWMAQALNRFGLAYLHVMRADFYQRQTGDVMAAARANFKGPLIGNMGYSPDEADAAIREGKADAIAFGATFISNPDLPARIKVGAPLAAPNPETFYTPGPVGYTDYPAMA